jgi:hypothetical protein
VGSLVNGTAYRWRSRAKDSQGKTSAWASYGGNAEDAADFTVNTNQAPGVPTGLAQRQANGTTAIPVGGRATSATVVLRGTVSDPNAGQTVRFQVEVKPIGTAFTGTVSCESGLVASGTATSCSVGSIAMGTDYHWRARAKDSQGKTGSWSSFGGNVEGEPDFMGPSLTGTWVVTGSGTRTNCADSGSGSGSITLALVQNDTITLSGSGSYVIWGDENGTFNLTSGTLTTATSFHGTLSGSNNAGYPFTGNYEGSVSGGTMTVNANTTDTTYGCYTTLTVTGTRQ